jgi:hypothetical protein
MGDIGRLLDGKEWTLGTRIPTLVFRQLFITSTNGIWLFSCFISACLWVDMFKRLRLRLGKTDFIDAPAAFLLRENNRGNSGSIYIQDVNRPPFRPQILGEHLSLHLSDVPRSIYTTPFLAPLVLNKYWSPLWQGLF